LASDGATLDSFGGEVSISGDTALIGACFDDDNGFDSGSAYVFVRTGTTWTEQTKLRASDGTAGDYFSAYAVSISSDTALIGAQGDDDNGADSGSAYVFIRTGLTWTEQEKLLVSDGAAQDFFGGSVSLSGDTVLIGAGGDDDNGGNSGSAYMFIRTGTTWAQEAKLLASDGAAEDIFGWAVALDGDTALIGAYYDDDNGLDSGSAYVFTKSENQPPVADFSWTPQNPITNQQITFNASASHDFDGTITSYEWDWNNDGVYDESHSSPTTTHSWESAGSYPVTVRITDDDNATGTIIKTVNVSGINLEIIIKGGFGVKAVITNNEASDANDISWQVHVEGGILGRINETVNGTISNIPAGGTIVIGKLMLFGFGPITITVKVADEEITVSGFLFLFFVIVVK
ncbi:MAG: PKD domain-containing protein, partial [Euryarchaeota archaeon]|nr:PKD domain-containing protein [Euryarchaeota archaeon]